MSLHSYEQSRKINALDFDFYALIMAAMRQADTDNLAHLKARWPGLWDELYSRYWAAGGRLPSDPPEQHFDESQESE